MMEEKEIEKQKKLQEKQKRKAERHTKSQQKANMKGSKIAKASTKTSSSKSAAEVKAIPASVYKVNAEHCEQNNGSKQTDSKICKPDDDFRIHTRSHDKYAVLSVNRKKLYFCL